MDVNGIHPAGAPQPIEPMQNVQPANRPVAPAAAKDVAEISDVARLAAKVHELPDVRTDLVERVKAEIQAGAYETPEKIDVALDRLMDELLGV